MAKTVMDLARGPKYVLPGSAACPGCGAQIALKWVLKILGGRAVFVIPACCTSVIQGPYPKSAFKFPVYNMAFAAAASTASGMARALRAMGEEDVHVVAWAGDGGTYDIGLQALSGAAERNEDMIYICYDNEAYMNTGIQRSGATPPKAWTKTTPTGKAEMKKNMALIVAAHGVPYVATASIGYPADFLKKLEKAKQMRGFRYIQIFAPCPTGWNFPVDKTVEIAKLAVDTYVWPLFEVEHGKLKITVKPRRRPLKDYVSLQKRFRHLTDADIEELERAFLSRWEALERLEAQGTIFL